jgi:hypothetical protein
VATEMAVAAGVEVTGTGIVVEIIEATDMDALMATVADAEVMTAIAQTEEVVIAG